MRIAIIGGGAAGMMCAATINENSPETEVFLLEKNDSLGKKVIISGGGRCNVTTGLEDIKAVLAKYPRGSKFLNSAMHIFPPQAVQDWFVGHGVPLKCEADNRVFPVSNNGHDIVAVFENIFRKNKTKVLFKHAVRKIEKKDQYFIIHSQDQADLKVDKVILTLGGQAYRQTGSTGDGYHLAENFGHHTSQLAPSLSSLVLAESWPAQVAGLSFAKATIKTNINKKHETTGPFIFTHWGLSGPAVFAFSALIAFENFSEAKPLKIFLDVTPDLSLDKVILQLKNYASANPKKLFKHALQLFVPLSFTKILLEQLKINPDKKNNEMSKVELRQAAEFLKNLPLAVTARRAGDEFVTAGGIILSEVDPSTMQSKLCPNLYFAGEILDIDGFTGGFNLQVAWATGRLAGLKSST